MKDQVEKLEDREAYNNSRAELKDLKRQSLFKESNLLKTWGSNIASTRPSNDSYQIPKFPKRKRMFSKENMPANKKENGRSSTRSSFFKMNKAFKSGKKVLGEINQNTKKEEGTATYAKKINYNYFKNKFAKKRPSSKFDSKTSSSQRRYNSLFQNL